MDHNWKILKTIDASNPQKRRRQIIDALLKNRGLNTTSLKKQFLNPLPPYKFTPPKLDLNQTQLNKALPRIKKAIQKKQLIYIYGDYDTDGITATAILWETLNSLKAKVLPYIPHRDDPVRGLSPKGIKQILKKDPQTKLIITVDNGITAFKGVDFAQKEGIDVIITDHHQPKKKNQRQTLPKAQAVIVNTHLCGAGIAWFLSHFLKKQLPAQNKTAYSTLSLAAIGTIGDMASLFGPNRSLVKFGLQAIKKTQRPGLLALAKQAKIDLKNLETWQISFLLSPRLNAMGRLEHGLEALRLLCTKNTTKAQTLAQLLENTNLNRQNLNDQMFAHAQKIIQSQLKTSRLLFASHPTYHEGIVGLVAGRLSEKYSRPAVVISQDKETSKGSARSVEGLNLIKILRKLEADLLELGGHEQAAGFTIKTSKIKSFHQKLKALIKKNYSPKKLPGLTIDCQIDFTDINWQLYFSLQKLEPFGYTNPTPIFATPEVILTNFRTVGQNQKHLQMTLKSKNTHKTFKAIAFNQGFLSNNLMPQQPVNVAYTIDQNEWNNKKSLQLKIKSIILT